MKVVYSAKAAEEVLEIVRYYEGERAGLAEHFLGALAGTLQALRDFPENAREIDQGVRRAVFPKPFKYNLYYQPDLESGEILVLAVVHQSRRPDAWRGTW